MSGSGAATPTYAEGPRGSGRQAAREEEAASAGSGAFEAEMDSDEDLAGVLCLLGSIVTFAGAARGVHAACRDAAREDGWARVAADASIKWQECVEHLERNEDIRAVLRERAQGLLQRHRSAAAEYLGSALPEQEPPCEVVAMWQPHERQECIHGVCRDLDALLPTHWPEAWAALADEATQANGALSVDASVVLAAAAHGLRLLHDDIGRKSTLPGGGPPDPFLCGALGVLYELHMEAPPNGAAVVTRFTPGQVYAVLSVLLLVPPQQPHPAVGVVAGTDATKPQPLQFEFSLLQLVCALEALDDEGEAVSVLARAAFASATLADPYYEQAWGEAQPEVEEAHRHLAAAAALQRRTLTPWKPWPMHPPLRDPFSDLHLTNTPPDTDEDDLQLEDGTCGLVPFVTPALELMAMHGLLDAWQFGVAEKELMGRLLMQVRRVLREVAIAPGGRWRLLLEELPSRSAEARLECYVAALTRRAREDALVLQYLMRRFPDIRYSDAAERLAPGILAQHPRSWGRLFNFLDNGAAKQCGAESDVQNLVEVGEAALIGLAVLSALPVGPEALPLSYCVAVGFQHMLKHSKALSRAPDALPMGVIWTAAAAMPLYLLLLAVPVASAALSELPPASAFTAEDRLAHMACILRLQDDGLFLPAAVSACFFNECFAVSGEAASWPGRPSFTQAVYDAAIARLSDEATMCGSSESPQGSDLSGDECASWSASHDRRQPAGSAGQRPGEAGAAPTHEGAGHDAAGKTKVDRLVHTLVEWRQATCSGSSRTQRKATQKRGSVVLVGKEVVALAMLPPAYFYPDGKAKDSILLQPACSKELYVAHGVAWPAQADVYQPPRDTDAVVAVPAFAGMRPAKDAPAFKDLYDWPKIHSSAVSMTAKTKWGDARRGVKRVLFEQKLRVCRVEARGVEGVQRALLLAAEVLADMRAEGRELVVGVAEYDEKSIRNAEAPQHKDEPHDAPGRPSNIIWAARKACTNLLVHGPPEDVERELLAPVAAALRELGTPGSPAAEALVVVLHLAEVEHGRPQQLIPGRKPVEPRTDKQRQLLEKKKLADVLFLAKT